MKRIALFLSAFSLFSLLAEAQNMQGTIVNGTTANTVILRLKNSSGAAYIGNLNSLRFAIRIADQGAGNPTVTATSLMSNPGNITYPPRYTENTYEYYDISVVLNGGNPVNIAPGAELDVFKLAFANGTGTSTVELVGKEFTSQQGSAGPNDATEFYVALDGTTISDPVNRFYNNGTNSTGLSNTQALSVVGLGGIVLPVSFTHIEAQKAGATALLTWGTGTEQNNQGFDIERSADGRNFVKVGYQRSLAVGGNSTANLEYSFTDNKPMPGQNQYRLKQMDKDGKFTYSKIVQLSFDGAGEVKMFPNPATTSKVIVEATGVQSIDVYNIAGQKVNVPVAYGTSSHELSTAALATGNYSVRITTATGAVTQKLVVRH